MKTLYAMLVAGLSGVGATLSAQVSVPCTAPLGTAPAPTVTAAPPDLVISWRKASRAVGYVVVRRNPDGTCWSITPQATTATSVREPIPATPGPYQYQVGVRLASGPAELSPWTTYDVTATPVATSGGAPAPTGLTATGTPTTATLTWGAPKGALNYRVSRARSGTTTWISLTPTPITTTTVANDVLPDPTVPYTYSVLAYQRNGQSGEARVDFRAPPPTNPAGLTGTASGSRVTLSWNPVPFAAGYLVIGPGIAGTIRTATTTYAVASAPDGANLYRVGAVFDPGGVQTASSLWPGVTVQVQAQPILTCACAATGPFTVANMRGGILGPGSTGTFAHPTAGTFTVTAQALGTSGMDPAALDIVDSQGQVVLSEGRVAAWEPSPDHRFFVVVYPPTSTNSGSFVSVFLVQRGPARWPRIIDATAWPDGYWGFGGAGMIFAIARSQYPGTNFSFEAYNLYAPSPATAVLRVSETNVTPGQSPQPLMFSPCGDRMMYLRYFAPSGQADFYRRTSFGTTQTPVITDYDASVPGLPGGTVIQAGWGNNFLVVLGSLRVRSTGQTNFPSLQCTP